jgi:hypothetical protein
LSALALAASLALFTACAGGPAPGSAQSEGAGSGASSANPYFTGDGGRGLSIAILAPKAMGLAENQDYLPALAQGGFVSAFTGYSAISVLDREQLDEQYAELLSGYYDENAEAGLDLGHLPPTNYIMSGNITKTATGYALQIGIANTADKMTVASHTGTCTFAELDNLAGVRRASLDLLQKIGVRPTERTRTELAGAAAANQVNAQTALAQGITAQQRGTEVAALTYYYQAAAYDPSLLEAASRVSVLERTISSGNIGEDARNDVRWRRDWQARLDEANAFFADYIAKNQPPCEIVYSTNMEKGKVDYSTETMPFSFPVRLFTGRAYFASLEKGVQAVTDGLAATGRNGEWRLSWPGDFARYRSFPVVYDLDFEMVNSGGKVIGTRKVRLDFSWNISGGDRVKVSRPFPDTQQVSMTVKVDDITDTLTIRVRAVNGKDPKTVNVPITAISERPPSDSDYQFDRLSGELYGVASNVTRVPANIWGAPVTTIGDRVFEGKGLTGNLIIPDSVTSIGAAAFSRNELGSLTIGNGVTSIDALVFSNNQLRTVTLPGSVRQIGSKAIMMSGYNYNDYDYNGSYNDSFSMKTDKGKVIKPVVYSINIGAGVSLTQDSFYNGKSLNNKDLSSGEAYGFAGFYNGNGKKAGTYIYGCTYTQVLMFVFPGSYQWFYNP